MCHYSMSAANALCIFLLLLWLSAECASLLLLFVRACAADLPAFCYCLLQCDAAPAAMYATVVLARRLASVLQS